MVAHCPVMGNLSVLVLDDDPTSLLIISKMLAKFYFKVLPFQTAEAALDFLKSGTAKELELDLILAEVHVGTVASGTLANSELLHHILNILQVPVITMCAYDDEKAVSECMALGACFHLLKPLNTGSFNILKQKALQHKSRSATTLEGPSSLSSTKSRMVSSSTKKPKEIFILDKNDLSSTESEEYEEPVVLKAHGCPKKAGRFKWTVELHEKFLVTVEALGDKSATPERILKKMNIKGLTTHQVASHLQKHRLRKLKAKQEGQHQQNASVKPVSELIRSAHNAATSESIRPRVDTVIREVYPSRMWTQMNNRSVEAAPLKRYTYTCTSGIYRDDTKSVWDKYQKSLQKGAVKNKDFVTDKCVFDKAPKTAGEIGYGAPVESSGSSTLFTSLRRQVGESNLTEAVGNNYNVGNINLPEGILNNASDGWAHLESNALVDDANRNSRAQVDLIGPYDGREEVDSFWMSQLGGSQEQQNFGPEDLLQVDTAWNDALGLVSQPSLINIDELMAQEAAVGDAPVDDTGMPFAQDQEDAYWMWSPQVVGDYDCLF